MKKVSKILVGSPTCEFYDYILDSWAHNVKKLTYPNYEIMLVDNSKEESFYHRIQKLGINAKRIEYNPDNKKRITESRNVLREEVLSKDYDYLLSLEQDLLPPSDIIELLMRHNKSIVGAPYMLFTYLGKNIPCVMTSHYTNKEPEGLWHPDFVPEWSFKNKLLQVHNVGLGCVLIKREVLEKIKFRHYPGLGHDDMIFYADCKKEGFPVYVDGTIPLIPHFQKDWDSKVVKDEAKQLKLDLGAGKVKRPGFKSIDLNGEPDYKLDLEEAKLPFKDNEVDEILALHTLEHIKNLLPLMNELHRVLKPLGKIKIVVPKFPHRDSVRDPTHVRYFVPETFSYFNPSDYDNYNYNIKPWNMEYLSESDSEIVCIMSPKK